MARQRKRRSVEIWAARLIKQLNMYTFNVWKTTSTFVHEIINKKKRDTDKEQTEKEIMVKYIRRKNLIRATDNCLFDISKKELLSAPLHT